MEAGQRSAYPHRGGDPHLHAHLPHDGRDSVPLRIRRSASPGAIATIGPARRGGARRLRGPTAKRCARPDRSVWRGRTGARGARPQRPMPRRRAGAHRKAGPRAVPGVSPRRPERSFYGADASGEERIREGRIREERAWGEGPQTPSLIRPYLSSAIRVRPAVRPGRRGPRPRRWTRCRSAPASSRPAKWRRGGRNRTPDRNSSAR